MEVEAVDGLQKVYALVAHTGKTMHLSQQFYFLAGAVLHDIAFQMCWQ